MARHLDQLLKLRQLRVVGAVAKHGSISRASRALFLSQPAVTKALQELEKTVGAPVYDRHAKGVEPTPTGHAVIETARRILAELARLDQELDRIASGTKNNVIVGSTPGPAMGLLPQILRHLRKQHSDLQVQVVEGAYETLTPALESGEIDLIVGRLYDPPVPDGFLREELFDDPVVLLARADHPILDGASTIEDVAHYELIVPPVSRRYGQEVDNLLARLGNFTPKLMRSSSIGFAREMAQITDAIVLAPKLMLAADLNRGSVRIVPIDLGFPPRPSGITYRSQASLPLGARQFVTGLKSTLACREV